jgi:hypothetical protein
MNTINKHDFNMPNSWEIILIVALVVILGVWYFTSVYTPTMYAPTAAKAALSQQRAELSQQRAAIDLAQNISVPDARNDVVMAPYVPEYIPGHASKPANMGMRELNVGRDVHLYDASNNVTSVSDIKTFSAFEEAPRGVTSTMWPASADGQAVMSGDELNMGVKPIMPGGAKTVYEVKNRYDRAARNQSAFQLDGRAYASALSGTKRRARQVGEQAGANFDLFSTYLKTEKSKPIVNCDNIGSINLPEWHPCWEALNKQIAVEDQSRESATGSASMAFRTLGQR